MTDYRETTPQTRSHDTHTLVDILCETAARIMLFNEASDNVKNASYLDISGGAYSAGSFQWAVIETCTIASDILHKIGGLPLRFTDERTLQTTQATGYRIDGYFPEADTWHITATQTGMPPSHELPAMDIVATTPELRAAHEEAIQSLDGPGYYQPLHPRSP